MAASCSYRMMQWSMAAIFSGNAFFIFMPLQELKKEDKIMVNILLTGASLLFVAELVGNTVKTVSKKNHSK